jgi:hypothetical protein
VGSPRVPPARGVPSPERTPTPAFQEKARFARGAANLKVEVSRAITQGFRNRKQTNRNSYEFPNAAGRLCSCPGLSHAGSLFPPRDALWTPKGGGKARDSAWGGILVPGLEPHPAG